MQKILPHAIQAVKTPFQLCSWKKQSQHTKICFDYYQSCN